MKKNKRHTTECNQAMNGVVCIQKQVKLMKDKLAVNGETRGHKQIGQKYSKDILAMDYENISWSTNVKRTCGLSH